jgi:hypothetical protein
MGRRDPTGRVADTEANLRGLSNDAGRDLPELVSDEAEDDATTC